MTLTPKDFVRRLYANFQTAKDKVGWLKTNGDIESISKVVRQIPNAPHPLNPLFFGNPWQHGVLQLFQKRTQAFTASLANEIQWTAIAVAKHASDLNAFFTLRQECECKLLRGEYEDATKTHEIIEKRFGTSLWSLQIKFILLEYSVGLEANTRHLSELNSQKDVHFFVQVIANFLSMRAERQLSQENYQHKLAKYLSNFDKHPQLKLFFEHATGREGFEFNCQGGDLVLALLGDGPLIDRCIFLISVLQRLYTSNVTDIADIKASTTLFSNTLKINEARNLGFLLNTDAQYILDSVDQKAIETIDCYTKGEYSSAAKLCTQILLERPTAAQFYEILVKSQIFSGENYKSPFNPGSIAHEILTAYDSVFRKNTTYSEAVSVLSRYSKTLYNTSLASGLRYCISMERTPHLAKQAEQVALLNSQFLNPRLCYAVDSSKIRLDIHARIAREFPQSLTVSFVSKLITPNNAQDFAFPEAVNEERKQRYTATLLIERGDFSNAIPLLENLYQARRHNNSLTSTYPLYDELIALLFNAYLRVDDAEKSLDLYVDNLLENPLSIHGLDVRTLQLSLEKSPDAGLSRNIKLPIFYAATMANPQIVFVPYDNFLSAYSCTRPTELLQQGVTFSKPLMTYFLSHVCVQQVMAGSFHFKGTLDLEGERLLILQHLCRIDDINRSEYAEEIDLITQRLFVRKGIQKLDEGKIYVDEAGIRRTGEKLLSESFRRYIDISSLKGIQALKLLDTSTMQIVLTGPSDKSAETKIDLAKLEADGVRVIFKSHYALFKDIFMDVRDRFISSSEYGLDSYLSVRIRHGTLQGQLRSRFEQFHLVTQKNTDTGLYQPNSYWDNQLSGLAEEQKNYVQTMLAQLSREVDGLTHKVKDEIIQVRTENRNPKGLIDFRFQDDDLFHLFTEDFEPIAAYPEFIDKVFKILWERTEIGLAQMREYMSNDLKNEFVLKLTNVQTDLRANLTNVDASDLFNALTSGLTSIQNECDRIARWFALPSQTFDAFSLNEMVNVCVASINNVNPDIQVAPDIDVDDRQVSGQCFHALFDILRTLLDNAVRHSGIAGGAPNVRIVGRVHEHNLVLQMRNAISKSVRDNDPVAKLTKRVAAIRTTGISDDIKKEGGTGYVKIAKILVFDLHQKEPLISFTYTNECEFQVTLEIEGNAILL